MVYRYAFKDATNNEAIALLPEREKLQAIERVIYKKLFGDDPTDEQDDTEDAKFTAEPKKNDVSVSNDGRNTGNAATPTAKRKNDTQEAGDPVDYNTTNVVAGISHKDQAAKTPPPEESQLTNRQKRILAKREALRSRISPTAWHRMQEANKILAKETARRDAISDKRNELLKMRPGGTIQQFSTYAPPTSECECYWLAEEGAQMKEVEQKLNIKIMFVFERSHLFRLWSDPADWDAFEKDPVEGMRLLARCEKFMEFWIWVFVSTGGATHRVSLTTCLEWFLLGEASPEYKEFTRLGSATKPIKDVEAIEAFKKDVGT
ncbi:uncharacterized protein EAE97_003995 [Botrytis byssoidea]|uniref:Uncharacterized protein n=1 Tax=Botrytis byssoidea TaxID=139641 RepID=A0A9P5LWS3_9HELO|nr:uncharacterized protein EAE97_003995 [Botrytis byssoidea]KAF7948584.1 hypothetical protein EAE97_003995 [Botrytis byssoidea]